MKMTLLHIDENVV